MNNQEVEEVLESLNMLKNDNDISKRFKEKTEQIVTILMENEQLAIEKALLKLEELHSLEMSSYHRTQVWGIISVLESMKR